MRQQKPPTGTVFLLCLNCGRGEFRRVGQGETPAIGNRQSAIANPECRHCHGPTEQRYPHTLALTAVDRGILNTVAAWSHAKTYDAVMNALRQQFRQLATERAGKGKSIPQWAADWLQSNPEKPL